jgi:hypothetical protein
LVLHVGLGDVPYFRSAAILRQQAQVSRQP